MALETEQQKERTLLTRNTSPSSVLRPLRTKYFWSMHRVGRGKQTVG